MDGESYIDRVHARAFERLGQVMEAVSKQLQAPPPAQKDMRAIFDKLAAQVDPTLFAMGYDEAVKRFGQAETDRQLALLIKRRTPAEDEGE